MTMKMILLTSLLCSLTLAAGFATADQKTPGSTSASADASVMPIDALLIINRANVEPTPVRKGMQDLKLQPELDPTKPQAISGGLDRDIIRRIPRKPKSNP